MSAPTWVAVVGVGALLLDCQVQVRLVEEPYLLVIHQASHSNYAAQAGRFVPLLGRLRDADKGSAVPASSP